MLAPAQQGGEFSALGLAQFETIAYIDLGLLVAGGPDEQLNCVAGVSCSAKTFTPKQGQYLAFIHAYTRLHRRPPAETDLQQFFRGQPALGSPNGGHARTSRLYQKATEGRPQHRSALGSETPARAALTRI